MKKEQVTVNIKAIAQVCGCKTHQASQFLQKMKELIYNISLTKKRVICLNVQIGQLWIFPNLIGEFRSNGSQQNEQSLSAAL